MIYSTKYAQAFVAFDEISEIYYPGIYIFTQLQLEQTTI